MSRIEVLTRLLRGMDRGELQEIELILGGLAPEEGSLLGDLLDVAQAALRQCAPDDAGE